MEAEENLLLLLGTIHHYDKDKNKLRLQNVSIYISKFYIP
jgi:hypothetical protein